MAASSPLNDSPRAYAGLRRVVLVVTALNFGYFWVETAVALAIGSVALLADGVDFLEDTAVNLLIALAHGRAARATRIYRDATGAGQAAATAAVEQHRRGPVR